MLADESDDEEGLERMSSNYPLGVTGNEFQIAGPDYERETSELCGDCDRGRGWVVEQGYRGDRWLTCLACGWATDLEPPEPDPDRAHDEAVERRLFGEDI